MRLLFARTEYGRPLFPAAGCADRAREALRRAFDATMKDPAFIAEAAKLQFDIDPLAGEEVQGLVAELHGDAARDRRAGASALEAPSALREPSTPASGPILKLASLRGTLVCELLGNLGDH